MPKLIESEIPIIWAARIVKGEKDKTAMGFYYPAGFNPDLPENKERLERAKQQAEEALSQA